MTTLTPDVSVGQVRDQVRDASESGAAVRIVGNERWKIAGRVVTAARKISTRELRGIVEYVPGDLTLTARAGTALAEIRDATAANNQWLALDPHGDDDGTLGATIATASAGPLATHFGTPRDLVLGLEVVTGTGSVIRAGGRVVKNVAGFDLTRLMIGAWGTLGVITEITVRLHARPECDETVAIAVDAGRVEKIRALLRRLPFTPFACEILNARLALDVVGRDQMTVLFRLAGNGDAVASQRAALAELGTAIDCDPAVWAALRAADENAEIVVRWSGLPSTVDSMWRAITQTPGVRAHASPARGIVRAMIPSTQPGRLLEAPNGVTVIAERLPLDLWVKVPPRIDALHARVKAAFDPKRVLNPGILGDAS